MQVLSIILAILAFGVLVIVHEFGHFITAKRGGVQVNEFWIGMGPTILKHEYHGTMYCLKLLPVGGACVMEGEDGESESKHAFGRARLRRRILIVAAGALMNFLIGFVILLFAVQAPTDNGFITTTVASISEGSSVLEGGLQEGDTIISIDGFRLLVRSDLNVAMGMSSSTTHSIKVRRGGETVELPSVPFEARIDDGEGGKLIGLTFGATPDTVVSRVQYAALTALDDARLVWVSLGQLLGGRVGVNDLAGPVGLASRRDEPAAAPGARWRPPGVPHHRGHPAQARAAEVRGPCTRGRSHAAAHAHGLRHGTRHPAPADRQNDAVKSTQGVQETILRPVFASKEG